MSEVVESVKAKIRAVENFPKEGIIFRDITTALKDKDTLKTMVDYLCDQVEAKNIDYVVGIESRGFIFGMPMAYHLNAGFIPVRKPNKLPADTIKETYELEYGTDTIEIHADALKKGDRVLVVDDLLATGGTAVAACNLVKKTGATIVGAVFLIELEGLDGRAKLPQDVPVISMLKY